MLKRLLFVYGSFFTQNESVRPGGAIKRTERCVGIMTSISKGLFVKLKDNDRVKAVSLSSDVFALVSHQQSLVTIPQQNTMLHGSKRATAGNSTNTVTFSSVFSFLP